jgi:hypothetical protein
MNNQHQPQFDTEKVIKLYEEKDGVPVTYICTTDLKQSDVPYDVFYRETPHPEFGNRYFGLTSRNGNVYIANADAIESLEFGMIENDDKYYYSQSHHDYKTVGKKMIDGGRAYIRSSGSTEVFKVLNGKFVKAIFAQDGTYVFNGETNHEPQ